MDFFVNPEDLKGWVKSQPSSEDAATKIVELMGKDREQDVFETCKSIFDTDDENASKVLFGVLSQHKSAQLKEVQNMNKKAQSSPSSRQRNGWERGMRNKWNRVVDGFNEGTPWRIDRDKFFNFTHYYTDALQFDADPTKVYSGEAIWRMYIMDKFTREYQNKEGKWVGGYINDRFYVFPDAGTPDNPKVARDGGNQLGLPPGVKTRLPRPHQYSTERRLEEARGVKTEDIKAFTSSARSVIKVSSSNNAQKEDDKVFGVFRDTLDMREAGIDYEVMLEEVSKHYDVPVLGVAQIDRIAQTLKKKHDGIAYDIKTASTLAELMARHNIDKKNVVVGENTKTADGKTQIPVGTEIVKLPGENRFVIANDPNNTVFSLANLNIQADFANIEDKAINASDAQRRTEEELGLEEEISTNNGINQHEAPEDFRIDEIPGGDVGDQNPMSAQSAQPIQ